jgi:hypothetical protein
MERVHRPAFIRKCSGGGHGPHDGIPARAASGKREALFAVHSLNALVIDYPAAGSEEALQHRGS